MPGLPRILCIVGPTSSGKTALGLEIAQKFNGEIINTDARQLYKGFVIGTGQPTQAEQQGIPHHLFGILEPEQTYTVTEWKAAALSCVREIVARGKLPILVGGTGLYLQALIDNYEPPAVPPQLELRETFQAASLEALVRQLQTEDPEAATWVDLKNRRRVERALEVVLTTGKSLKEQRRQGEPLVEAIQIGLQRTPDELRLRINTSIDQMVKRGWQAEVKQLIDTGISLDVPAMSSIGYSELANVLRGELELAEAVERIRFATWQYAKRQLTWFKRDQRIRWFASNEQAIECLQSII